MSKCFNCSETFEKVLSCGKCRTVHYCGKDCQKAHWPVHKSECGLKISQSYMSLNDDELVAAKERFQTVVQKYKLTEDADLLADIICGGVVTASDVCSKVGKGMTEVDATDLLRWISIGVDFKERALDPNVQ